MASGPAAGLEQRYTRIGCAAFALARRICGEDAVAADIVEQALMSGAGDPEGAVGDGLALRRVRELACARRRPAKAARTAIGTPPQGLRDLPLAQWRVLDLVALRGATVREAAIRLQLPEASVLTHLHDGLRGAGARLSGERQPHAHADAPRLALLR
jgi:DNA-directed RNA polymerase specialized sigma24 family protein